MRARNVSDTAIRGVDTSDPGIYMGCVCRLHSDGTARAALADTVANARAVGVFQRHRNKLQPVGVGSARVMLAAGLNSGTAPAVGQPVWLDATTPGRATNVAPGEDLRLGVIQSLEGGYNNTLGSLAVVVPQPLAI
jgi:hypothetical protein